MSYSFDRITPILLGSPPSVFLKGSHQKMSGARSFVWFSTGRRWWSKERRPRNLDDTNGSISPSQYCPDPNGIKREGNE